MAANQTIIQAAKAAYTRHKVDISGQLASMAAISKMVVGMGKAADEKLKKLNKAFDVGEKFKNQKLLPFFKTIRNSKDIPYDQKLTIAKNYANDDLVVETWSKDLQEKTKGKDISKQIPATKSTWHSSIIDGSWFETTHDIDLNNDGDFDDEGERGLEPVIMDYKLNRMKILNEYGEYVTVDDLDASIPTTIDSDNAQNIYDEFTKKSVMNDRNVNNLPTARRKVEDKMKAEFKKSPRSMVSFAYDRPLRINDTEHMTFVEYFLQNYLKEEVSDKPRIIMQEGKEVEVPADYEFDAEGKIIRDYDLLPEYNKIVTEYNKWIDGDDLDPQEKEEFGRNLFRSIVGDDIEDNSEILEELLKFIGTAAEYELNTHLE